MDSPTKAEAPVLVACAAVRDDLEAALESLDLAAEVLYLPAALHLRPTELSRALAAALDRRWVMRSSRCSAVAAQT